MMKLRYAFRGTGLILLNMVANGALYLSDHLSAFHLFLAGICLGAIMVMVAVNLRDFDEAERQIREMDHW